ncbi:hypothetical protein [Rhizobium binxianense]
MPTMTSVPEPTPSQMRLAELLLFPLRTALVIAPLWFVYWMFARFSLSDVSILYDAAIWLSVALAVLSVAKTGISMRVAPNSVLLRHAWRLVHISAIVRRREFWRDVPDAVRMTPAPDVPGALPRSELRVLRPIELFIVTPLRLVLAVAVYIGLRDFAGSMMPEPAWLGTLNSWIWFATFIVYIVYVLGRAAVALVSRQADAFEDARRLRDWTRRFRR